MKTALRTIAACAAVALTLSPLAAEAQSRHGGGFRGGAAFHGVSGGHYGGYYGGHYGGHYGGYRSGYYGGFWGPGLLLGGLGIGLALSSAPYYATPYYGAPVYSSGYVVADDPSVRYDPPPVVVREQASRPAAPDPVVYPSRGQSAAQTESDRQGCNKWAMSQPAAMADASVFQRATLACLEGRGYTVR